MTKTPSRFYLYFSLLFFSGVAWLLFNIFRPINFFLDRELCVLKNTVGIPCPSCGTTRSVMAILNGTFTEALYFNPLGFPVLGALLIVPCWILVDLITSQQTLYGFITKTESRINNKKVAYVLALLVVLNWLWNIYKHR